MRKGYLTLYLSLCLTLMLAFVLTVVEGARRSTIRMEGECVADIALNSVLAEYHRELLEQYDLLFVDMSYGTSTAGIENTTEHLRRYLQKNFERTDTGVFGAKDWLQLSVSQLQIKEVSLASDEGGNVMKRQALEYMKSSSVEGLLVDILDRISILDTLGFDRGEIEEERRHVQNQIDEIELPVTVDEEGNERELNLENPADQVNQFRNSFLLGLLLGDTSQLSGSTIQQRDYLSQRNRMTGAGIAPGFYQPDGAANQLLFDCYLFEKCGWYGNELEKSLLKYQIEYLIAGQASDLENLEQIVKRLVIWREGANGVYLFSDQVKCMEAETLARTITAVILVPELAPLVKYSILFAWAYIESLSDVKILLKGGKIPLIKASEDWRTDLDSILDFSGEVSEEQTGENGLNYQDYLRIMLYLENSKDKNLRAMDIMEMDIRMTGGNRYFRIDNCIYQMKADVNVTSQYGYGFSIERDYSYE